MGLKDVIKGIVGTRESTAAGKPILQPTAGNPAELEKMLEAKKNDAFNILKKELAYFLRLYYIAKELDAAAVIGSSKMYAWYRDTWWASSEKDMKNALETLNQNLYKLKNFERREQWRVSVNKLRGAIQELLKFPLDSGIKEKSVKLSGQMKVFEADLLERTVKKLEPALKELKKQLDNDRPNLKIKPLGDKWRDVEKITAKLVEDLRVLSLLDNELQKLLDTIPEHIIPPTHRTSKEDVEEMQRRWRERERYLSKNY